jgi:hypothetical protein
MHPPSKEIRKHGRGALNPPAGCQELPSETLAQMLDLVAPDDEPQRAALGDGLRGATLWIPKCLCLLSHFPFYTPCRDFLKLATPRPRPCARAPPHRSPATATLGPCARAPRAPTDPPPEHTPPLERERRRLTRPPSRRRPRSCTACRSRPRGFRSSATCVTSCRRALPAPVLTRAREASRAPPPRPRAVRSSRSGVGLSGPAAIRNYF